MLLNRLEECWVKHELLLWDFSEPLKYSLCCEALDRVWEALHPFHLFFSFANISWDQDGLQGVSCWLTVGRVPTVPTLEHRVPMFPWHVLAALQTLQTWGFPSHLLVVLLAALGSRHGKLALPLRRLSTCLRPEAALEGPVLLMSTFSPRPPAFLAVCVLSQEWISWENS